MYPHPVLRLTAARHALGQTTPDRLVEAAHAALGDGVYCLSLGELAYVREPSRWECDRLFRAALEELGMAMPDPSTALRAVADHVAAGVVEAAIAPKVGLAELYALYMTADERVESGVTDPLWPFVTLYYEAEEARGWGAGGGGGNPPDLPMPDELVARCVSLASGWCRDRWAGHVAAARSSPTVVSIAAGIEADGAFDRLPVLADALEDAGCDDPDVLAHCRSGGPHVRGCWAVDLVLGKK